MTTIFFPDVSHYESGLVITPGTPVVIAKATQGTSFVDYTYQYFKQQAANVGAVFVGYHWLMPGNVKAQAQNAFNTCGQTPLMIDAEEPSKALSVADITGFIDAYRALGGIVRLLYLPHWYWANNMGSPSLTPVGVRSMVLVASEYRAYSDTNWPAGYGRLVPKVWQYTDKQSYNSRSVDFNAFKGTKQQFLELAGGVIDMDMSTTWTDAKGETKTFGDFCLDVHKAVFDAWGSIPKQLNQVITELVSVSDKLDALTVGNGLSDEDRAAINALKGSVDGLAHQLSSP